MSIYEIAEIAQVSPATVSKVLNGRPGVSESVRNRVLEIIEQQNFTPKTAVNVQNNIAMVSRAGDAAGGIFYSDFMIGIMRGVSEYAFDHGYNITLFPSMAIPKKKSQFSLFCRKQRLAGMVFGNLRSDDSYIEEIAGIIPLVTINACFRGEQVYSICSDDYNGMYNAVRYLYELGHRRIAIATVGLFFDSNHDKLEAYKKALTDFQLPCEEEYIMDSDQISPTTICLRFERLKKANKMPTAILTMNDQDAVRIINFLRLVNISCPQDISIMGYDDYDYAENINPALTTVKQVLYEKGKLAAQLACGGSAEASQATRDERGRYIFKTQIVIRDSVRRISQQ